MGRVPSIGGITRRQAIFAPLIGGIGSVALNGYAFAYAPAIELNVTRYRIAPEPWRNGPELRIAVLTDLHFGEPFVSLARLDEIVLRDQRAFTGSDLRAG